MVFLEVPPCRDEGMLSLRRAEERRLLRAVLEGR